MGKVIGPGDQAYDLSSLNILLLSDAEHTWIIVRGLLSAMRIENITLADDERDALRKANSNPPDLLIIDWITIPVSGERFITLVRNQDNPRVAEVPILLLTPHTELHRIQAARDAGVNHVSAKPVSFASLYRAIAVIVEDQRPFVRCDVYIGPDRRWKKDGGPDGERRKIKSLVRLFR